MTLALVIIALIVAGVMLFNHFIVKIQPVASANYLPSDTSIHLGFTPIYGDAPLVYGYKGESFGFVTPPETFLKCNG